MLVLVSAGIELISFLVTDAMLFWIWDENNVEKNADNTLMFYLLVGSAYSMSSTFQLLTLPCQRAEAGGVQEDGRGYSQDS